MADFVKQGCRLGRNSVSDGARLPEAVAPVAEGSTRSAARLASMTRGPVLTGGDYSLIGGFWAAVPASSPGPPLLSIRLTPTNAVLITWPSPSTGFVLEQNSNLGGSSWAPAPENVADDGTTKSVVVNPPMGTVYYRLK